MSKFQLYKTRVDTTDSSQLDQSEIVSMDMVIRQPNVFVVDNRLNVELELRTVF